MYLSDVASAALRKLLTSTDTNNDSHNISALQELTNYQTANPRKHK